MHKSLHMPLKVLLLAALFGGAAFASEASVARHEKKSTEIFKSLETLKPGEKLILDGEVFYSKPLKFDYDKDGVKNNVIMAAKFFIKKKKDGSYDGYIQRYLYDVDKKRPIRWYSKKNMLQEPPISLDTSVKNVKQDGKTVTFDSGPWHVSMTDGGEGFVSDKIIVSDKIRTKEVEMFGGDIKVYE